MFVSRKYIGYQSSVKCAELINVIQPIYHVKSLSKAVTVAFKLFNTLIEDRKKQGGF